MSNKNLTKSFKNFCPRCVYFQQQTGVCKKFYFNVPDYPNKFHKKCNGNYFKEDATKTVQEIDELKEITELENNAETIESTANEDTGSFVPGKKVTYAGFWVRVASFSIDGLIIVGLTAASGAMISPFLRATLFIPVILVLLCGLTVLYFGWFNANGRQPIGKKVFGIVVTDSALKPISLKKSLLRARYYLLSSLLAGVGNLFILFTERKRAFHDLVADTVVVHKRKKRSGYKLLILVTIVACSFPGRPLLHTTLQAYRLPTGGMKPTLLVGDFILVDKSWSKRRSAAAGDLIVFKYPEDPSLDYIKRCIAVAGQTIEVRNGDVYIDGKPEGKKLELGHKYDPEDGRNTKETKMTTPLGKEYVIRHYVDRYAQTDNFGPVTVPEGHYFMMGDNRDNSADSRSWGFLPEENITGQVGLIYFSWDKTGAIWNLLESVRWSRVGKVVE